MVQKMILKIYWLSLIVVSPTGCINRETQVDINETAIEDKDYRAALDKATCTEDIVTNFETRYTISATFLGPEFRAALAKRVESIYKEPETILDDATNKAGFFVTMFSPEREGYDISDEETWTITLEANNQKLKPILIKKLSKKERWSPFFPHVHKWSKEYLILFETASVNPNSPDLVEKTSFLLTFANADAKVRLNW